MYYTCRAHSSFVLPSYHLRNIADRVDRSLARVLHAMQCTRHLDRHEYIQFKNWRLFGKDVLSGEPVSVWIYEGTLNIEYQTTALSLYAVRLSPDHQITEVTNLRRLETRFRSHQLDRWQVSDTEWLVAPWRSGPGPRLSRSKVVALAKQLVLPEFSATE